MCVCLFVWIFASKGKYERKQQKQPTFHTQFIVVFHCSYLLFSLLFGALCHFGCVCLFCVEFQILRTRWQNGIATKTLREKFIHSVGLTNAYL